MFQGHSSILHYCCLSPPHPEARFRILGSTHTASQGLASLTPETVQIEREKPYHKDPHPEGPKALVRNSTKTPHNQSEHAFVQFGLESAVVYATGVEIDGDKSCQLTGNMWWV